MSSIFLSHNSKDKRFARRIGKALADRGVKVWIDEAEIKVGDSLLRKISEGIKDMEYLGVVLSPNSVSSSWVQKEVEVATTLEIKNRKLKVLPILYKDCEVPLFLQDKVYADFRNRYIFQHSLIKLLDVLLPHGFTEQVLSVVRNAINAEFDAYKYLPKIKVKEIDKWFSKGGSARTRIVHLLYKHKERGWIINNPLNPSTVELLNVKLKKIQADRATVTTEEYWYLRWFDVKALKYRHVYNVKNDQSYVLVDEGQGTWRVDINIYLGSSHNLE